MKVCKAAIVPLFPVYDHKNHQFHIHVRPPMDDIDGQDDPYIARRMNEEVEARCGRISNNTPDSETAENPQRRRRRAV